MWMKIVSFNNFGQGTVGSEMRFIIIRWMSLLKHTSNLFCWTGYSPTSVLLMCWSPVPTACHTCLCSLRERSRGGPHPNISNMVRKHFQVLQVLSHEKVDQPFTQQACQWYILCLMTLWHCRFWILTAFVAIHSAIALRCPRQDTTFRWFVNNLQP